MVSRSRRSLLLACLNRDTTLQGTDGKEWTERDSTSGKEGKEPRSGGRPKRLAEGPPPALPPVPPFTFIPQVPPDQPLTNTELRLRVPAR